MDNITQVRKEIYELKQLLTVEKLRTYRRECAVEDLDKVLTRVENLFYGEGK